MNTCKSRTLIEQERARTTPRQSVCAAGAPASSAQLTSISDVAHSDVTGTVTSGRRRSIRGGVGHRWGQGDGPRVKTQNEGGSSFIFMPRSTRNSHLESTG